MFWRQAILFISICVTDWSKELSTIIKNLAFKMVFHGFVDLSDRRELKCRYTKRLIILGELTISCFSCQMENAMNPRFSKFSNFPKFLTLTVLV